MKLKIAIVIFAALLVSVIGFTIYFIFSDCEGTYHTDTIHLTNGNTIEIRADNCWEISQGLEYRISGSDISYRFGSTIDSTRDLKFLAIEVESGNLIAIVEAANPDVVLILHDFKNGNSWPFRYRTENYGDSLKRGMEMLKRIKRQNTLQNYVLSQNVPGNRKLKISA
jgi:hypothetical protein